ncbi:cytochrome c maturation protein CcmE [Dokdonella sp.]|uniref:cytochrome c maturation protein CcmE n=1 Tax=Dokdonella sp. TaxID=2291710 RepID=UPI002F417C46
MTPTRKRRLIVVSLILAAVGVAAGLTVLALQQNMTYLYSPSEVAAGHAPAGARFRLGGVVLEQSIRRAQDSLEVHFIVTDRFKEMPVEYTGILPDLFREGQSIVATGALKDGRFIATEVLAKHDESYMPKEVKDAIEKAKQAHAD